MVYISYCTSFGNSSCTFVWQFFFFLLQNYLLKNLQHTVLQNHLSNGQHFCRLLLSKANTTACGHFFFNCITCSLTKSQSIICNGNQHLNEFRPNVRPKVNTKTRLKYKIDTK